MCEFWWQVQQHEEEEWGELLKRDPGYAQWLDLMNKANGNESMTNFLNTERKVT